MRSREERRALLAAVIDDPQATHRERLMADQALAELEQFVAGEEEERRADLTPDEVRAALVEWGDAAAAALAVHDGPDAVRPPDDPDAIEDVLALAVQVNGMLERRVKELELALAFASRHRLLPPAPQASLPEGPR